MGDIEYKCFLLNLIKFVVTTVNCLILKPDSDKVGRKEGNVLFNDALNTFYLRL